MALFHLIARLGNLGVVHFLGASTPLRVASTTLLHLGVVHFLGASTPTRLLVLVLFDLGVVHFLGASTPYAWVLQLSSFLGVVRFLRASTPLIITQQCQDKLWAARFRGCSHLPRCCYLRSIHCKIVGSFSLLSSANSTTFDTISTVFGSSSTKGR